MPSYQEMYEPLAIQAAERHNIDPAVFLALIHQESKWNPNALSGDGAVGIAQIIPRWHPECVNPWNAELALDCAAFILRNHLDSFGGRYDMALAAYHQGGPTAARYGGLVPSGEMSLYVKPILDNAATIREALRPVRVTPAIAEPAVTPTGTASCVGAPTPTPVPNMATATPSPPCLVTPTPPALPADVALFVLPLIWAAMSR
jgi:hypothetical protein